MPVNPKTVQKRYKPEPKFSIEGVCENAVSMIPIEIKRKSKLTVRTLEREMFDGFIK